MSTARRDRGVAVVTGGSAGLGRAITRELAARGWDIGLIARGRDGLEAAGAEVAAAGCRWHAVSVDVADAAAVDAAAGEIEERLGPIRLWVNNAMAGSIAEFLDTSADDFERATAVTYLGAVNGTRAALARMVPRDAGQVIQIGSALAHRGIPLQAAYCGAKHAIHGFSDAVVAELTHAGSAVALSIVDMPALNTVQFEWVQSSFEQHPQPVPPIFQPEVGARAVADVADRPRRRTWVGEPTVGIILGKRFAGRFLDWYLARSAYGGQLAADKPASTTSPNLHAPVPGDHGARGSFDDRAWNGSPQTWAIGHRRALGTALGAAAAIGGALVLGALRRR